MEVYRLVWQAAVSCGFGKRSTVSQQGPTQPSYASTVPLTSTRSVSYDLYFSSLASDPVCGTPLGWIAL